MSYRVEDPKDVGLGPGFAAGEANPVGRRPGVRGTTVALPLGGVASTDPCRVRSPWVRPFWLLAGGVTLSVALFVWLRLTMF